MNPARNPFPILFTALLAGTALLRSEVPPPANPGLRLDPRVHALPDAFPLATAVLDDSRLLVISGPRMTISAGDRRPAAAGALLLPDPQPAEGRPLNGPLLKTSRGTLVLIYGDPTTRKLSWNRQTGEPNADLRAKVWAIRSIDGGKTWIDRQEISSRFQGISPYALSIIQLAEAKDGTVVVPIQLRLSGHNRNAVTSVISRDQGRTWIAGKTLLDIGGAGIHDGLLEPTLTALEDGRVWMLLRTGLDVFYQTYSNDSGLSWSPPAPTTIAASSSPGYLLRLHSGRLLMLWNRVYPEGQTDYPRRSGKGFSLKPASWQRDELVMALSDNDGRTWSEPAIIVRDPGQAAYPSAFERRPGEIWVSIHYRDARSFRLFEKDFADETGPRFAESEVWGAKSGGFVSHFVYGLEVTAKDTVLAACEARVHSGDASEKKLLVRRSTDQGRTWSADAMIEGAADHNSWSNPTFVSDGPTIYLFYTWTVSSDVGRVFYRVSTDDGATWSDRTEITALWDGNPQGWTQHSSIGHGIRKLHEPAQGQLFLAFNHRRAIGFPTAERRYGSDVITLTPHGWIRAGQPVVAVDRGINEADIAERADGALVLIGRQAGPNSLLRGVSVSTDAGAHWSEWTNAVGLRGTPTDSGLLRYGEDCWLYSYPAGVALSTKQRRDLTIAVSRDGGSTWVPSRLLHRGQSTYSDLARDSSGNIYCIYGRDGSTFMGDRVFLARFNLEWVNAKSTAGEDGLPQ